MTRLPVEHWARECDASLRRSRERRRPATKREHAVQLALVLLAIAVTAAIVWRMILIFAA